MDGRSNPISTAKRHYGLGGGALNGGRTRPFDGARPDGRNRRRGDSAFHNANTSLGEALHTISELRRRTTRKPSWPSDRAGPVETNCPLRRSLFLTSWHILPQHFIDARLPAAPPLPECLQHVRVEPQRLVDLSVRLRRPATAAAHQLLGRLFANKFRQHVRSGPRPGEIFLRPFGIVLVGARGPVIRRLFCHTVLPLVCLPCGNL